MSDAARSAWGWGLALAAVLLGQGLTALELFGGAAGLRDGRPVVSGRHPLHLYHGSLGAATFRDRNTTSCYDPAFQAGYPKTPVFDGACRPAEVVLLFAPQPYDPAAYKMGLFALCLVAPLAFAAAAWGAGLPAPACVVAAALGSLLWWSDAVQPLLHAGAIDLLLAGLVAVPAVPLLAKYSAEPGPGVWCLLAALSAVGWWAQPLVWLGLLPVGLGHFFLVAPRHGLAWHLGRAAVTVAGLVPNLWWLTQWGRFWWLRSSSIDDIGCWPCLLTVLGHWDEYPALLGDGLVTPAVALVGLFGLLGMLRSPHRQAAGLVLLAGAVAVAVARAGQVSPTLQLVHAEQAASLAVAWLSVPAAYLLTHGAGRLQVVGGGAWLARLAAPLPLALLLSGAVAPKPLLIGLSDDREELVQSIRRLTTTDARILWEEADAGVPGWNWSALLPPLTERAYLGGLDGGACVEHAFCGLRAGRLNGRPLAEVSARDRREFVTRYNVGWVVARTAPTAAWWAADPTARELARFKEAATGESVVLFRLDRTLSFVLSGRATVERADRTKIVLTDVTPDEDGEVILSFHHQPGLRVAPSSVRQGEGTKDLFDPIPFLKLRLPGPMSRVVLAWDNP